VAAAAAFATFVALTDRPGDVSDRTDLHPVDDSEVEQQSDDLGTPTQVPAGKLLAYEATELPPGYVPVAGDGGDPPTLLGPSHFGVNCLDWHTEGASSPTLVCDEAAGMQILYYGRPGTSESVFVATAFNLPYRPLPPGSESEATTVHGAPGTLRPGTTTVGPQLIWAPQPGAMVIVEARSPTVTDDELLTIAEGLRPGQITPSADMGYAVAELGLPADLARTGGPDTVYVWARPGPDGCQGALLVFDDSSPCEAEGWAEDEVSVTGGGASTVIAGAVPPGVEQVEIETLAGETIDAELVDPGAPFRQRFFLTPVGNRQATAVVARAADGTELQRTELDP
jgi:hypothetical protein